MKLPPHVTCTKTGIYRYRRVVPERLRETIGQREIKRPLGRSHSGMLRALADVEAEVERLFDISPFSTDDDQRQRLIKRMRAFGFSESDIRAIDQGQAEGLDDSIGLLHDFLVDEYEVSERRQVDPVISLEAIRTVAKGQLPQRNITLASCLDDYLVEKRTGNVTRDQQTTHRVEHLKRRLEAYLGRREVHERPLRLFSRADARHYRDKLLEEVKPSSARRTTNILKAAINFVISEYQLDMVNPVAALKIKGSESSSRDWDTFTEEEVKTLSYMASDDELGDLWVTLRDTGSRLREIAELPVRDVDIANAVISIRPGDDRRVKTANSEREVPLSPEVTQRLAQRCRGLPKDAPVFPSYCGGRKPDNASAALVKRVRRSIDRPKVGTHSLRHRMKDCLRNTDCPDSLADEIMGHGKQSTAKNYGAGSARDRKREALKKVWAL